VRRGGQGQGESGEAGSIRIAITGAAFEAISTTPALSAMSAAWTRRASACPRSLLKESAATQYRRLTRWCVDCPPCGVAAVAVKHIVVLLVIYTMAKLPDFEGAGDARQRGDGPIPCFGGPSGGVSVAVVFPS
jgi:hypothetical protein